MQKVKRPGDRLSPSDFSLNGKIIISNKSNPIGFTANIINNIENKNKKKNSFLRDLVGIIYNHLT